jgi:diguanylate cyclase (GGDEF)-like protein
METPVYMVDVQQGDTEWLSRPLTAAGLPRVEAVNGLDALSTKVHRSLCQDRVNPALVLLIAENLDALVVEHCLRFQPLVEEAILGVVLVIHGPHTASVDGIENCLDIIHTPNREFFIQDTLWRLQLTIKLLMERRKRLEQEYAFSSRIDEHRQIEARLNYLNDHDELTGLANRAVFEKALEELIWSSKQQSPHALLYLDLDRFKLHNDATGHGSGNYLLQTVARHLRTTLPDDATIARLGSDEFAVLMPCRDDADIMATAEQLRRTITELEPDGDKIVYHIGMSIGVTTLQPDTFSSASQALARAEQACYVAKSRGGNTVQGYNQDDGILQHLHEDMHWTRPFRQALNHDEFYLAFQPILDVKKSAISHYEALIRMPERLGGEAQSANFMLAAERLGVAPQIDLWVVNSAIDYLVRHPEISLAVNLSSHVFQREELVSTLKERLGRNNIDPARLIFELTETAAISNFPDTRRVVDELRQLGCRFALDDFGSGFSSYHYIKQFPIDILKIDGSFITNLLHDKNDRAIVQSMIEIAHTLGKEVVAEFIENAETLKLLIQMGIDHAQGYYIGTPQPLDPSLSNGAS